MSSKYQFVRDFVSEQVALRESETEHPLFPSEYWKDYHRFASYVSTLPDKELEHIRYHTFHLTGDIYTTYHFTNRRRIRNLEAYYEQLIPKLDGFLPVEPAGGIGVETKYGLLNGGIVRYATALSDLIASGSLDRKTPQKILEIGGGYGGLALMCLQYNPQLSYVLCDLEETLFFQGVFLTLHLGSDKVHTLRGEPGDFEDLQPGHAYLFPQRLAEGLEGAEFDLAINQQSMQEMTEDQVARYCEILKSCCQKFYSCNLKSHGKGIVSGKGVIPNVHKFHADRFSVTEWDSYDAESALVRLVLRFRGLRSVLRRTIGIGFMPKGEGLLHRFVYRCG